MSAKTRWNDPFRSKDDPRATLMRHRVRLLAMDGIVSVGLGFDEQHRTVIVLGVAEERPAAQALPEELEGVPVEVRRVGKLGTSEGAEQQDGQG